MVLLLIDLSDDDTGFIAERIGIRVGVVIVEIDFRGGGVGGRIISIGEIDGGVVELLGVIFILYGGIGLDVFGGLRTTEDFIDVVGAIYIERFKVVEWVVVVGVGE